MSATRELLGKLAAHDELCVQAVLAPQSRLGQAVLEPPAMVPRVRVLVELAALLAADAPTPSLRWAVDRAVATGADDHTIVQVLVAAACAAGAAQTVQSASRLALALDVDTDVCASREDRRPEPGPQPPNVTPLRAFGKPRVPVF
jgi:alkylhydroperoxidase/carboxymuconolactone decarboxylase family protein YurZ